MQVTSKIYSIGTVQLPTLESIAMGIRFSGMLLAAVTTAFVIAPARQRRRSSMCQVSAAAARLGIAWAVAAVERSHRKSNSRAKQQIEHQRPDGRRRRQRQCEQGKNLNTSRSN